MSRSLLILGASGHSVVATEIAESLGFTNISYCDIHGKQNRFLERNVSCEEPRDYADYFFVAIGDNSKREIAFNAFRLKNPSAIPVTLVHPSSVLAGRLSIGEGSIVMPLCAINGLTSIGKGVIVNTRSSIDHGCTLVDFSSIAPGATLGGNVFVDKRSAISIGSTISHNVKIGKDVVVGGCSLVLKDVEDNVVVYGVPAKLARTRARGDKYL